MLTKSARSKKVFINRLSATVETEVKAELLKIAKNAGLRNRRIDFTDAMGSCTIEIECRDGGRYVINSGDFWKSGKLSYPLYAMSYLTEDTFPELEAFQNLLCEYNELSQNLFAIEFTINV